MSHEGMQRIFVTGLTEVFSVQKEPLGAIRREGNKKYKYVKFDDGTATLSVAAGDVVFYKDYANSLVVADLTDIQAGLGAGVCMAAMTDGQYGWIQIGGISGTLNTDASAAAGQVLTAVAGADKTLIVVTAVTQPAVGVMIDATASSQIILCDFPE